MTTPAARGAVAPAARACSPTAGAISPTVARVSLGLTLLAVLVLYTWGLSASGYANAFYSAASLAGAVSWKAFLYGSLDGGNWITVDKTPASVWLMSLSVRLFGLSSWSVLLPQALLGVGSAAILFASVRRSLGGRLTESWHVTPLRAHVAGLVAAATMAVTPAATLMFRYNNPDALMVFCYVLAAYCTIRATETASRTWLALAGVAIGLGFLAKMLQAFVVLPALALAYAVAAPASWRKKVVDLLVSLAALVVSFGWYLAVVELVPVSSRPYIGGSQTNSILELTFGYNGLGRLSGNETGSVGSLGGSSERWGSTGILRMLFSPSGELASFLIPGALILAGVALAIIGRPACSQLLRRREATGETMALGALVLYSSWLVVNGLVFSFMAGIYHDYYTVALAPAIAGTVAVSGTVLWVRRRSLGARIGLAAAAIATALWSSLLASAVGAAHMTVALVGMLALVAVAVGLLTGHALLSRVSRLACAALVAGALVVPTSYSIHTALTPHSGSILTAGPLTLNPELREGAAGRLAYGVTVSSEMTALLTRDATRFTWVAATVGGQSASSYELATRFPVMAVGGFNGSDPSPTLEQFRALVAARRIHYYIAGDTIDSSMGGSDEPIQIARWVSSSFMGETVGDVTVYDLTKGK